MKTFRIACVLTAMMAVFGTVSMAEAAIGARFAPKLQSLKFEARKDKGADFEHGEWTAVFQPGKIVPIGGNRETRSTPIDPEKGDLDDLLTIVRAMHNGHIQVRDPEIDGNTVKVRVEGLMIGSAADSRGVILVRSTGVDTPITSLTWLTVNDQTGRFGDYEFVFEGGLTPELVNKLLTVVPGKPGYNSKKTVTIVAVEGQEAVLRFSVVEKK